MTFHKIKPLSPFLGRACRTMNGRSPWFILSDAVRRRRRDKLRANGLPWRFNLKSAESKALYRPNHRSHSASARAA
jgi:hypothetical protein